MTDHSHLPDRALSIRQPWAWAIVHAGKDVENRSRRFNYRGPICLHASLYIPKKRDHDDVDDCLFEAFTNEERWEVCEWRPEIVAQSRGGIIGTAEIVDCIETSDSPWFFGPYGLVLRNVKPVPFIPVKGALGLFNWKGDV